MTALVEGPPLSLVMFSRNHERYVADCLTTLFTVDQECELVFVDNGSTDNSVAIVRAMLRDAPAHITWKVVELVPEQPLCRALNIMVRETSREFVKPISADDKLGPNFFPAFRQLVRTSNSNVGMWLAGAVVIDGEDRVLRQNYPTLWGSPDDGPASEMVERHIFERSNAPLSMVSQFFRRSAWNDVGGYDERYRYEDRPFIFNLLKRGWKIVIHPYNNTYYRQHSEAVSLDPAWMAEARLPIAWNQALRAEWRNKPIAFSLVARNLRVVARDRLRKWKAGRA